MLIVKFLGQFDVHYGDQPILISSRPVQTLFAYLILHAGATERRERLAGLIWPRSSEENARSNLRHALWRLRKALSRYEQDPPFILSDDLTISFEANSNYWLDVNQLEGGLEHRASIDQLTESATLYAGELLPGFYDEWVILERDRIQSVFDRLMQTFLNKLAAQGRWPEVLEWGERWLSHGSTSEAAYRSLMMAQTEMGDRAAMAAVYHRCVDSLRQELGVAPSIQTRELFEELANRVKKPFKRSHPQAQLMNHHLIRGFVILSMTMRIYSLAARSWLAG
jgi:DNA-binding SARP family transcriptional activator